MARAELLLLEGYDTVRRQPGEHLLMTMPDHHHQPLRPHGARRLEDVQEHGTAAHAVEHLG